MALEERDADLVALGVVGWAVAGMLLARLTEKGYLQPDEMDDLMTEALAAIETSDALMAHETYRRAASQAKHLAAVLRERLKT